MLSVSSVHVVLALLFVVGVSQASESAADEPEFSRVGGVNVPEVAGDAAVALVPASSDRAEAARVAVVVNIAVDEAQGESLRLVLEELLSGYQLSIRQRDSVPEGFLSVTPKAGTLAQVWIVARGRDTVAVYLHDPRRDRVLRRTFHRANKNRELLSEQIGEVLRTALDGLSLGQQLGQPRSTVLQELGQAESKAPSRPESPEPAPPAPAESARSNPWALLLAPYYRGTRMAEGWFADGPGLSVGAKLQDAAFLFQLNAGYRRAAHQSAGDLEVALRGGYLRVFAGKGYKLGKRWTLLGLVGGGVDVIKVSATPLMVSRYDVEALPISGVPVASTAFQLSFQLDQYVQLCAAVGLDVDVTGTRFVVDRLEAPQDVVSLSPLRPFASLGAEL